MKISEAHSDAVNQPLIDIDRLSVTLGGTNILRDVSLSIHSGEFIGLIGQNGSGKSTLVKAMLELIPSKGRIKRGPKTSVGYVQQRGSIHERQTPISVMEVVMMGSKGDESVAKKALRTVGMLRYASRTFTNLSGGQQQKVYIAKALAINPNLFILDEPTTGIDEQSQAEFYEILQNLHKEGVAVLMISHNIDTVLRLVERVICINGAILYDGPPEHFEADKHMPKYYLMKHRTIHHNPKPATTKKEAS